MKRIFLSLVFMLAAGLMITSCSNLFENIINEDMSFKKGDDTLFVNHSGSDISSGLVVIKSSEKKVNQIKYSPDQKNYFVGKVPSGYKDFKVDYKNGTKVSIYGKDGPVELRCFVNDINANIQWNLVQTWAYIPEYEIRTIKDLDGNEVVYRGIKSQAAKKLDSPIEVNYSVQKSNATSFLTADLPYGVSVATCKVIADDEQYFTEYKIILTKEYIPSIADSPESDANNVTDHGLVVIKASDPGRNAISFSSTDYEYEIGDSTGKNTALDLTGRDDPVVFKCYTLDEKAVLSWTAVQKKEYVPQWDSNKGGITSQELKELEKPVVFDFVKHDETYEEAKPYMQFISDSGSELKSNLPYGVTEVYATITSENENEEGELVETITQYKVTLTKRYIITTGTNDTSKDSETGLAVFANGKSGNLISYNPLVLNYTVNGLNGSNDPVRIEFRPEEPDFTITSWTAKKTHSFEAEIETYSNGKVSYTLQTGGKFVELSEPLDILDNALIGEKENDVYLCTGNLPYGTTVVTVSAKSQDDKNSETTYSITFNKKQISTKVNIVSASGDELNTVTDRGLVVLGAQNDSLNRISFDPAKHEYKVDNVVAADNDMRFRCYLADTDAKIEWDVKQIKEFKAVTSIYEEEVVDSFLGIKEKRSYTYISGQEEKNCDIPVAFAKGENADITANEIKAKLPYGITQVTATISAKNEETVYYTILLRHDICKEPVSEDDFKKSLESGEGEGNYSKLKELELTVVDEKGDENSKAELTPEFSPSVTTYNLKVDEESDIISIEAIAASEDAEISEPKVITKYGEVPAIEGMNINLVGGKSKVTFTVTDETNISRTYTIYVDKPEDGDTSLAKLDINPAVGFNEGLALDKVLNTSYKGNTVPKSKSYYNMTLSADSRKDVSEVVFEATPNNKRTVVSYGISDSDENEPVEWSKTFDKSKVISEKVIIGNDDVPVITKVLWIKTVSDEYYHSNENGYEKIKRADTTYHKIKLTKAGNASKELTALVIDVTYENKSTKSVNTQISKTQVASKVVDVVKGIDTITTFADVLEIYFRPLDKDAEITYSVVNTEGEITQDITEDVIYEKISGTCDKLNDNSTEYHKLTIGSIDEGIDSTKDLPRGETVVTICGRTFTFTKPDLKNVSYTIGLEQGELKWDNYIYLKYEEETLVMNLTSQQQNQILTVESCEHILGPNDKALGEGEKSTKVHSEIKRADGNGENLTTWKNVVENIPVGTTRVTIKVTNGKEGDPVSATRDFYIVRADTTETRLKTLVFDGKTPDAFKTDWQEGMTNTSYTYNIAKPVNVEAGKKVLTFAPLYSDAYITLEKYQSANGNLTDADDSSWTLCAAETKAGKISDFEENFTLENSNVNAGTSIKYIIKVSTVEGEEATHVYNIIIHVEADKTAQLDALKIIQAGEIEDLSRTILANRFKPDTLNYKDLYASLNYKGDIVITPNKYAKASIVKTVLKCDGEEITSENVPEIKIEEDGRITIPYDVYSKKLGSTYNVSYEVQAQDTSVETKTYTAEFMIPEYQVITETEKKSVTKNLTYEVPVDVTGGLGYRFGSVISDESLKVKDFFGGIDIVGSSDGKTWYENSFGGSGFQFVMNIDGKNHWVKLDENGKLSALYTYEENQTPKLAAIPEGIDFGVVPQFVVENEVQYLELEFVVTNKNAMAVKLGAAIDTLIGTVEESSKAVNDRVNVKPTNNGFTMNGKKYSFSVIMKNAYGVDDVTDFWYGAYDSGNFLFNIFDENKNSGLKENEDSAASFYWDIGEETVSSKKIRITMGSVK